LVDFTIITIRFTCDDFGIWSNVPVDSWSTYCSWIHLITFSTKGFLKLGGVSSQVATSTTAPCTISTNGAAVDLSCWVVVPWYCAVRWSMYDCPLCLIQVLLSHIGSWCHILIIMSRGITALHPRRSLLLSKSVFVPPSNACNCWLNFKIIYCFIRHAQIYEIYYMVIPIIFFFFSFCKFLRFAFNTQYFFHLINKWIIKFIEIYRSLLMSLLLIWKKLSLLSIKIK